MKKDTKQKVILVGITIVTAIAMIWINTYQRSVTYFKEGETYLANDQLMEAITSFESSAHAYTPWNSNVRKSLERLWEIGERLEKEKDAPEYPLIAYRSLRSSVYAIRSLYMPYKEWIPRCDEKIRQLVEIRKARIKAASENP